MKKLIVTTIFTVMLLFAFSACHHGKGVQGSGVRKTEKRDLGTFKSIETTGAYEIQVTCQQAASFELDGDDNILPLIRTEARNGVLHISNERSYSVTRPIILRIGVPDLEGFTSHGAGDVHITNIKNEKLTVMTTGAANIEASGQTQFASITSTGAGKIDTHKLRSERAKVTVTGAAIVDVYASQQLDATVSGVGQVIYYGKPAVVNKSVSGIGSITEKESGA